MSWRLLGYTSNHIIKTRSFSSIHNIPTSPISNISSSSSSGTKPSYSSNTTIILTPQIVQSTLLNSPSDLVALSFFLWCARQPHYFHEPAAVDHMVDVVRRLTQLHKTVQGIIEQLECVGFVKKPQTLLLLLRIYWRGGMHHLVFETFEQMIKFGYHPNTFARNILMDVLLKIRRIDVALRVFNMTQVPNFLTFSIAICNLCRLNDVINVQDVIRKMLRKGYHLNAELFSMVLNCYCKLGRLQEALQLLGLMITGGIPVSVSVWSILIHGFCRIGRLRMASYLLGKMVEAGCSPNVVTCTSLIKGFMDTGNSISALSILSNLESKGCSPDLVLYNVLIDCLSKIGRYEDALDFYFSLRNRNMAPDSYTYCSLITNVSLSKEFDLLPILVNRLRIEADFVLLNYLLSYFCKAGMPHCAVELYSDMLNQGFVPDRYSYLGLLSGLLEVGKTSLAFNVYHGMIRSHFNLDAYIHTAIIDGLTKSGRFRRAIKVFRKASGGKYPVDVVSYTVAINALLRGGKSGEAYTLYERMKEAGMVPSVHTYIVLLSGLGRERDVQMVKQILGEMVDQRIELDLNTLHIIRKLLFKFRLFRSVENFFIELQDSVVVCEKAKHELLDWSTGKRCRS